MNVHGPITIVVSFLASSHPVMSSHSFIMCLPLTPCVPPLRYDEVVVGPPPFYFVSAQQPELGAVYVYPKPGRDGEPLSGVLCA